MVWKIDNPQCNESKKIVWEVARYLRGRGLDLGAGDFKVLPHAISVDNMHHHAFGFTHKPDVLCNVEKLDVFASCSMDFVYSSHTLEHIVDYKGALREWWRIVKQGGYLILYLPHKLFYPNIGCEGSNPDHKHDFMPEDVISAMPDGWDLIENQDRNDDMEYSMLLVFKKIQGKKNVRSYQDPKPSKTACVTRYGAFGDVLQSSSVWAALKAQGYHVSVISSPPGCDAIKHDPNIDELIIFDKDQIPNQDLGNFWAYQKKKYDKWVNLSESVEGTFLAIPGRMLHTFLPRARHSLANMNYVQFQHELAGVGYKLASRFYPTKEELAWAVAERARMNGGPVVVWSLAGSSVHKTWPYVDAIWARLLLSYKDVRIVLVGGEECKILERGFESEPRVYRRSGVWEIRKSLTFAMKADLVVGPETGVLNAVALESMPKVIFLSHSTVNNLTRDWVNTTSLWSKETKCNGRGDNDAPACHQLHHGWDHCTKNEETSTAQCQADIGAAAAWDAISAALRGFEMTRVGMDMAA